MHASFRRLNRTLFRKIQKGMPAGGRKRKEHVKVTTEEPATKVVVKNLDDVGAKMSQYFPPDKWEVSVVTL